jgi:hypothetical protein
MTINFNVSPYHDDYDENKKYLRILFRPGYPVQARELTQLQTLIQNQIARHGDHIFKQGAMVLPGQISYDDGFNYIKVQNTYNGISVDAYIDELVGYTIVGNTTGVRAKVVAIAASTTTDASTLYVKYIQSGDDTVTKVFQDNEILTTEDKALPRAFTTALSESTGVGSAAQIQRGVYYVNGFFMLVEEQTLLLDKYSNTPSYRVGLKLTESIITPEEEPTLQDNAQGSSNFAAPGAHRYQAQLTLEKRTIETTEDKDFIELLRVKTGQIQYKVRTTEYSVLEATLARRTYDESGNYTIRNFPIDVREHRNNNRGTWTENTAYKVGDIAAYTYLGTVRYYTATTSGISGSQPPIHSTGTATDGVGGITWRQTDSNFLNYNRGIYDPIIDGGDEAKLAFGMEPGKAYVQGYEIEKIGTEYVDIEKSRDFARVADTQIQATIGNYIKVTNLHSLPRIDIYQTVDLYDQFTASVGVAAGNKIGTARIRGIELDTLGASRATDVYKILLSNVKVDTGVNFARRVKQLYYNSGATVTNFTADIAPVSTKVVGSGTASSSTTITGNATTFKTDFIVGDYISLGGTIRRITGPSATGAIGEALNSDTSMTVSAATTVTGVAITRLSTIVLEPDNSALLFSLPFFANRKIRSIDDSTIGTSYTVTQRFVQSSGTATGGTCTLTINNVGSADTFGSAAIASNFLLVDNTTGTIVIPNNIEVVSPALRQVIFTLDSSLASRQFIIFAAVKKSSIDAKEKTKTLTSTTQTISTKTTVTNPVIKLNKADIWKIDSIKMDTLTVTGDWTSGAGTYTHDISDYFYLDDGQRDEFYDVGTLTLKQGYPAPVAPIRISFQYFDHGSGDYFSVDSYSDSGIRYEEIPSFAGVQLRDVLDFRPRIDDTGTDFASAGSSTTQLPKRGFNVEADLSYYLARKDKIAIDFNGKFFQVKGVPSLNPAEPEDPKNAMVLYKVTLEPYTFATSAPSVVIQSIDNRRYTMRDIGAIEKRLDNLEYYTSLSLLEQETVSLSIPDEQGLDRYKNGFIVDGFSGHGVGDPYNPDYNCSIDMERNELRPFFRMDNVNLIEKNSADNQRISSNYQLTGDIITLPYSKIEFIKQSLGSRVENINPFAIFTFIGKIELNPSSDEWFEVDRRPDIVNNVEGNFNAIQTALEKSGALGTVWNSWQTQWTGATQSSTVKYTTGGNWASRQGDVYLSQAELTAKFGNIGWGNARQITVQSTARDVGQARTGVKTVVVPKVDREIVEDKVLSTAVIPYMRSRPVLIQALGFKPNSRLYTFFDSINVDAQITPATKISFTAVSGFKSTFDSKSNAGSNSTETARRVGSAPAGDTNPALNRGDVITGLTSGATAVCVGYEITVDGNEAIHVLNISGTFQLNEVIVGSISSARGRINTAVTVKSKGDPFISTFNGSLFGLFNIPNTDALRFRCGVKELRITDSSNNGGDFTSRGMVSFRAQGILETKQATFNAVRNATIASEVVNETQTITETSERVIGDTGWWDPLAQTFLVQQKGGAFLTDIDIYFATKDDTIPVSLEIREVVNGYPGKRVLPFSKTTITPDKVNISSKTVSVDGVNWNAPDTPTKFTFSSPVFVDDATEYALILSSDSNNYRCWISQMGDKVAGTDRFISEQPYQGVLFKSQNASTWTADQNQDLMFTIYRAKFATNVQGKAEFVNDVLPNTQLQPDPLKTTSGSNKVRVEHPNHDMFPGSKVRIQGLPTGTLNGIPSTELNTLLTISDVDLDCYTVTTTTNATATGYVGGLSAYATDNVQFDTLQPIVQTQNFSETNTEFVIKSTSGRSVDGSEVPYIKQTDGDYVLANQSNDYTSPRVIASEVNESSFLSGDKSIGLTAIMTTTNDSVSPVIDTHRTSLICIHNKINNATQSTVNVSPVDNRTVSSGSTYVAFTSTGLSTSNTNTKFEFLTLSVGRYVVISGATTSTNNGTYLVKDVALDGSSVTLDGVFTPASAGTAITLTSLDKFYDEIAPFSGSNYSKYLTRRINLANSSTFFKVRMAVNVPTNANIDVYYKLNKVGTNIDFATVPYTLVKPNSVIPNTSSVTTFTDIDYSVSNLAPFDAITIKIVFRSTNSAGVPRVRDFRVIACP